MKTWLITLIIGTQKVHYITDAVSDRAACETVEKTYPQQWRQADNVETVSVTRV